MIPPISNLKLTRIIEPRDGLVASEEFSGTLLLLSLGLVFAHCLKLVRLVIWAAVDLQNYCENIQAKPFFVSHTQRQRLYLLPTYSRSIPGTPGPPDTLLSP